jgi:hypothetical protein
VHGLCTSELKRNNGRRKYHIKAGEKRTKIKEKCRNADDQFKGVNTKFTRK